MLPLFLSELVCFSACCIGITGVGREQQPKFAQPWGPSCSCGVTKGCKMEECLPRWAFYGEAVHSSVTSVTASEPPLPNEESKMKRGTRPTRNQPDRRQGCPTCSGAPCQRNIWYALDDRSCCVSLIQASFGIASLETASSTVEHCSYTVGRSWRSSVSQLCRLLLPLSWL